MVSKPCSSAEPGSLRSPFPEARAFLGVGSNIEPEKNVSAALELLSATPGITLAAISTFYRTEPLPGPASLAQDGRGGTATHTDGETAPGGGDFLNGVIEIRTEMDEEKLEASLRKVETRLGRVRDGDPFGPRTLDLDLLLFLPGSSPPGGAAETPAAVDETIGAPGEASIHPDVTRRPFVAWPLLELAPEMILPAGGPSLRSVAERFDGPGGDAQTRFTRLLRSRFLP